jgi:hypothetical protein
MEVPGKTRKDPTEKKQEIWQGGGSHWSKKGVWNLTHCLVGTTLFDCLVGKTLVLGGGMELLYAERRVCTGVETANLENGQGVGGKENEVITWLS